MTSQHSGSPLLGILFIGYALLTLVLTFSLEHGNRQVNANVSPAGHCHTVSIDRISDVFKGRIGTPTSKVDFAAITDIKQRKQAFFDYLLSAVDDQNTAYTELRHKLWCIDKNLRQGLALDTADTQLHRYLAQRLRAKAEADALTLNQDLLNRVDIIPASMVLSQGAMESAWGTSRFATTANNYFGQWCFSKGCGIVPQRRNPGATHEVAAYQSVNNAATEYFLNINRHPSYSKVRNIRQQARIEGQPLLGINMVKGLEKYSARGHAYIEELQSMIRYNKIQRYD